MNRAQDGRRLVVERALSALITVRLPKPLSISKETVVQFSNAGTFADLSAWQKAWNLRAQVRQAKRDMKLKHAALVGGPGIKKPPRVIRETEEVERLLTDIVDHPKGARRRRARLCRAGAARAGGVDQRSV